ncbi:hypothetical protein J7E91_28795 [Streptomyces sp. ISL-99]|uniref:hypothetical protein n=1 Tax=Streptomyces sp. ISL-99 TaxID=2819193 RepID=UPI001BEB8E46|nr:hypothetical protein [Streptomyces sp. ISL-99]MBT2529290.1 hypothetical protein [Streptomyces sp. ISL-99]
MRRSRWTDLVRRPALAALYFLVLTPIGLCVRRIRDPLRRSWHASATTYWDPP